MNTKGKLIVIEGLDGSGKSTQLEILLKKLVDSGCPAERLKFPDYDSRSSELVKLYLNGEIGELEDVNLYAVSAFFAADRYISYQTGWKNGYGAGGIYVSDRYTTSNMIYQTAKLPESQWEDYMTWLADFEYTRMGLPEPDGVIYLDMPPDISRALLEKRYKGDGEKLDIHERSLKYLEACRKAALYAAEKLGWRIINCGSGTGEKVKALTIDEISKKVFGIVKGLV